MDDLLQSDLIVALALERNERDEARRSLERIVPRALRDIDNMFDVHRDDGYVCRKVEEDEVAEQR